MKAKRPTNHIINPSQEAALRQHLAARPAIDADKLIRRIKFELATFEPFSKTLTRRRAARADALAIAAAAQTLLDHGTHGVPARAEGDVVRLPLRSLWETHWGVRKEFVDDLARMLEGARKRAETYTPTKGRGRRREVWSNEILSAIRTAYESDRPGNKIDRRRVAKHRVRTERMVFGFAGVYFKDMGSVGKRRASSKIVRSP